MHGRNRQQSNPYPATQNGYPNGHANGYANGDSPISAHSYQPSYETMTSGSDDYAKSTNPSSQNSSYDQLHQLRKPDEYSPDNPYANEIRFNGMSPHKLISPYAVNNGYHGQEAASPPQGQPNQYAPNNPRQPIKLNGSPSDPPFNGTTSSASSATATTPKRQSWIKRKFSRRDD